MCMSENLNILYFLYLSRVRNFILPSGNLIRDNLFIIIIVIIYLFATRLTILKHKSSYIKFLQFIYIFRNELRLESIRRFINTGHIYAWKDNPLDFIYNYNISVSGSPEKKKMELYYQKFHRTRYEIQYRKGGCFA